MHRFFCPTAAIQENTVHITDKTLLHHIRDVLRYGPRDKIVFFDETGTEYEGTVLSADKERLIARVDKRKTVSGHHRPFITIACAIPRQTRMEDIVDKLTQLGIDRIIPMITERVIVKLDMRGKMLKLARWQKIAVQASEQSKRITLPIIGPVLEYADVLSEARDTGLKLIPTLEGENRRHIRGMLPSSNTGGIIALIGPEGDFTRAEINAALRQGFHPVSLGATVLRVDTAAVALSAILVSGLDI